MNCMMAGVVLKAHQFDCVEYPFSALCVVYVLVGEQTELNNLFYRDGKPAVNRHTDIAQRHIYAV